MFKIHSNLESIAQPFTGILLDAYGVFWAGNSIGPIPGAKEVMERLVSQGKILGILSNTTQLPQKEIDKIAKQGIIQGKHFHFYLTSGQMAKEIFLENALPFPTPKKKYWLFGTVHPKHGPHYPIFEGTFYTETQLLEEADFIYISIPHKNGEDISDISHLHDDISKLMHTNLPMVCSNPDGYAHEGMPLRAVVRQGSIAALYAKLGGKVFYIGKPATHGYLSALKEFSKHKALGVADIIMVGDTPETDIRGARLCGMSSALITRMGNMGDRMGKLGDHEAIKTIPPCDTPNYFIERL